MFAPLVTVLSQKPSEKNGHRSIKCPCDIIVCLRISGEHKACGNRKSEDGFFHVLGI